MEQYTNSPRQRGQRGKSPETLQLVSRAKGILDDQHPHSVRGVCYQLFVNKWLRSRAKLDTDKVNRHLVWAVEAHRDGGHWHRGDGGVRADRIGMIRRRGWGGWA